MHRLEAELEMHKVRAQAAEQALQEHSAKQQEMMY